MDGQAASLQRALTSPDSALRLKAAMAAGTRPQPAYIDVLIERCAVEPDFFVRDMLTWALIHNDRAQVVPRVVAQLGSDRSQAVSQALHTLSKLEDPDTWPAVTSDLLEHDVPEIRRTAWRAAVHVAPESAKDDLASLLIKQLGRGDGNVQLSLSRALVALGEHAQSGLRRAARSGDAAIADHARATLRLAADPAAAFEIARGRAQRQTNLKDAPLVEESLQQYE